MSKYVFINRGICLYIKYASVYKNFPEFFLHSRRKAKSKSCNFSLPNVL